MHVPSSVPIMVRLGIPGLSSLTDRMTRGGMYALVAETPPARYPILASSLGCALKDGVTCTIISGGQPDALLARLASFGNIDIDAALASKQLQVFVPQENFAKKIFRFGAEAFWRELDYFAIPENSYLIFDQADELLSLHDITIALEQVETLRQWFSQHHVTALLLFSRVTSSAGALGSLHDLMDRLAGIVRVGGSRDGLELTFDYWQSPEGAVAAKNHRLLSLDSGLYKVSARPLGGDKLADDTPPPAIEPRFFFTDSELVSLGRQMPGIWQHVDSLVGVLHATRLFPNATVILTFRQNTDLRQLAETVHTLRHSLGRRASIVIQEKNASLRYQNEALLLRLGVNLVVHRDVPVSRLPLLLESLTGQVFERDIDIQFESALASAMPTSLRGYLPPGRFAREAQLIVERAATLNIPCALIAALPARDTSTRDILARVRMSRSGDLITADNQRCYLFLSGCPEASLLATLERVLGRPVDACFEESRFAIRRPEIEAEISALAHAAERTELPDFSSQLAHLQNITELTGSAVPGTQRVSSSDTGNKTAGSVPVLRLLTPRTEAVAPASPADLPAPDQGNIRTEETESLRFHYAGKLAHAATYGKQEAPRATRSTAPKEPHSH